MLQTTRGIVFHTLKYAESSIIAKIYTEISGLQSFMVRGLRSKKSTLRNALFQHLTLVELVAYHREKKDIQNLKEIKVAYPFKTIPFDIRKSTLLLFINEVLYQVVREEESNGLLFNFLFDSIIKLDTITKNIALFHLVFLIQLSQYLGFYPKNNYDERSPNFELSEGQFSKLTGPENLIAEAPYGMYFSILSQITINQIDEIAIPSIHRRKLLEYILNYYRHHIPDLREFKSHLVLQDVLAK